MNELAKKIDPRATNLETAAAALSVSAPRLRQGIEAGRMRAIRIGQRILVPMEAIDEYVELLQREADEATALRLSKLKPGRPKKARS